MTTGPDEGTSQSYRALGRCNNRSIAASCGESPLAETCHASTSSRRPLAFRRLAGRRCGLREVPAEPPASGGGATSADPVATNVSALRLHYTWQGEGAADRRFALLTRDVRGRFSDESGRDVDAGLVRALDAALSDASVVSAPLT